MGSREWDRGLERVPGPDPIPEVLVLGEEGFRGLLDLLEDDLLRRIALWKFVGLTHEEIARRLGCSLAKVERKVGRIREKWAAVAPAEPVKPGPRAAVGAGVDAAGDLGGITTILRALAGQE
jgi:hypothetical protein